VHFMTIHADKQARQAAIYCRVSTPRQEEEGTSLFTQEERCRAYGGEQGYGVDTSHVYIEVKTGTDLWERPELSRLREVVRGRGVDVVIAYAIDRLSRDPVHLGVILSEADHCEVDVEFVSEPLDNSTEGQLIRFVRGYAAKVETEKIRERNIRGKRARVENGKIHNHGIEMYGYRRTGEKDKRAIYETEAAIVRRIFHWYTDEKLGVRAIATRLNNEGIPSLSVNKRQYSDPNRIPRWAGGQTRRMLREPAYKGETITWRTHKSGYVRPQEEWIYLPEGVTPPIVPQERWEYAQNAPC
jgi:site-specific DNA recombinase